MMAMIAAGIAVGVTSGVAAGTPAGHLGRLSDVALAMPGLPEMLVVLAIVVVLFGATKLPQLGKGLGEAIGNFKKSQRDAMDEANAADRPEEIDATPKLREQTVEAVKADFETNKESSEV